VVTREAARAWIEAWEEGWPTEDAERIVSRYRPDAPYRSHPFRDLSTPREYVTKAFGEEKLVRCWFGEPIVEDGRAAVEYWSILRSPDGADITIAGTAVLAFGEDGLVVSHWDYWTQRDGAIEPPPGWATGRAT
jgi:nuclear transport factor 2 (NTF2) superfamily protein